MHFSPLHLHEKNLYMPFWQAMPQHSIDYSFVNIWGWCQYFNLEWCFDEHVCWLRQKNTDTMWAPVGAWDRVDWHNHEALRHGMRLVRVPEQLATTLEHALPGRVHKEDCRGQWEYLYSAEELLALSGNRFHKKRNHVNSFKKHYGEPDYHIMDENSIEDVLRLQDEWCQWHECSNSHALQAENEAINRVLSHWQDMDSLVGGAIYVSDVLVAFSVGEILGDDTLGVHYEKGRTGFRGVYQTMNNAFIKHAGASSTLINRAQDLDEEGLRHAKSSYLPVDFLRKYTITIAPLNP